MIVKNSYDTTLKVAEYIKNGGTHEALMSAMKIKTKKKLLDLIKKQNWDKKKVKAMTNAGLISFQQRRQVRGRLKDSEEITKQVVVWMEELGHLPKFCNVLGLKSTKSYNNRVTLHNWTAQELAILISKRIVDDNLEA